MLIPHAIENLLITWLSKKYSLEVERLSVQSIGGGSINNAATFGEGENQFFIKWNSASQYPLMFKKEAKGLRLLRKPKAIPVVRPLYNDVTEDYVFLVMEYIERGNQKENFWENFAESLADLHKNRAELFGLEYDNYMGSLIQSNNQHKNWSSFFIEERLIPQVKMATDKGELSQSTINGFETLYIRMNDIFPKEKPALVHGDLWSGNFMINKKGRACLIDPAAYFGHREVDIAMSRLFGGFSSLFYEAYDAHYPLERGWEHRIDICNLYPLLVHVNLFGGGYTAQVRNIIRRFL